MRSIIRWVHFGFYPIFHRLKCSKFYLNSFFINKCQIAEIVIKLKINVLMINLKKRRRKIHENANNLFECYEKSY